MFALKPSHIRLIYLLSKIENYLIKLCFSNLCCQNQFFTFVSCDSRIEYSVSIKNICILTHVANEDEEEEEEEAGVQKLREEADMPLSEVIAMYASGGFPKTPKSKLLGGPSPMSPFLRAKPSSSAGVKGEN